MIYEDFVSILSPREVSVCPAFPLFYYSNSSVISLYTVKKVSDFPVPSRGVSNQALRGREKFHYSRPRRVWLVTFRLGMGKSLTFFTV